MSLTHLRLLALAAFVSIFAVHYLYKRWKRRKLLPPGPTGLPLLGNIKDMPTSEEWLAYAELAKQYGDVVYMEVLGQPLVILNSLRTTCDLFEKRSSNYSDRLQSIMIHELMAQDWNLALLPYNDRWRRYRKIFHSSFQPQAATVYQPIQLEATHRLLSSLLDKPEKFLQHLHLHSGQMILKIVYGHDVHSEDDTYLHIADNLVNHYNENVHGAFMVDFFPILRYMPSSFPGAKFWRIAKEGMEYSKKVINVPFDDVKAAMAQGNAPSCMLTDNLVKLTNGGIPSAEREDDIRKTAAIAYIAGSDTTVSGLETFVLAMVLHPEVQKKAQAELDAVTGHARLPNLSDKASLPYIRCILQETLRWNPVTPLAIPHKSMEDDIYDGHLIPGGSIVIGNAWAILHDEEIYPDAMRFNPDRFVKREGRPLPPDPSDIAAFGFGRRTCPGRNFAMDNMWLAIAMILSTFSIAKAVDENGVEITPNVKYVSGTSSHPEPFQCRFLPRSKDAVDLIRHNNIN